MLRWLPEDVSPYGAGIDSLFYFVYYLTAVAFILVTALMIIFLYVYRDQGGRRATYTHGNTALEIIWTIIPALVFIGLGLGSRSLWENIKLAPPETNTVVKVTGKQFNWEIVYPGPDGEFDTADDKQVDNDIRVPAGKPVRVILTSKDVIHSFFLPNLRFKQDTVPGREITGWFQANKPGKYEIPCAELCGFGHSGMVGWLYALAPDEYQAWQNEEWPQTASSNGTATDSPETTAVSTSAVTDSAESEAAASAQEAATEAAQEAADTGQDTEIGATEAAQGTAEGVQEAATEAAQDATEAAASAQEAAGEAGQAAPEASQDTTDSVHGAAQDAVEATQTVPEALQEAAPTTTEKAAEAAEEAATGATQEAPAEGSSSEASTPASDQESSADASSVVSPDETAPNSPVKYAFTPAADPGRICQGELEIVSGATIYALAQNFYQETKIFLGVDLIREYNTHITNLDHIYPGQKLCIPSLSRATRLRQSKESGSYNLILDSFRSTRKANALIRRVQQKGYEALLTNRQVSDSLLLKRVEITGLQDQTAANQAWTMFAPANAEDLS